MSAEPVSSPIPSNTAAQTDGAAANTAAPTKTGGGPLDNIQGPTSFSNMGEFLAKGDKKVVNAFMQSIAEAIIRDVKRGGERLKEAMKKNRQV